MGYVLLIGAVIIVITAFILVAGIKWSVIMTGIIILVVFATIIGFVGWVIVGLINWFDEV